MNQVLNNEGCSSAHVSGGSDGELVNALIDEMRISLLSVPTVARLNSSYSK